MGESIAQRLDNLIEELANGIVFLEFDSEDCVKEIEELIAKVRIDSKSKNAKFYNDTLDLWQDNLEKAKGDNAQNLAEYVVIMAREAAGFKGNKDEWIERLKHLVIDCDNLSQGKDITPVEKSEDIALFVSTAYSLLEELETNLLNLENNPKDANSIDAIYRDFHTLKGEAGLLGIKNCATLSHTVEDILEPVRQGQGLPSEQLITLLLQVVDLIKSIVTNLEDDPEKSASIVVEPLCEILKELELKPIDSDAPKLINDTDLLDGFKAQIPILDMTMGEDMFKDFIVESHEHISTAEQALLTLENNPDETEEINVLFRAFHTIKGLAGFLNLNDLKLLTHDTESMMDDVRKGRLLLSDEIMEACFKAIDSVSALLNLLQEQLANGGQLVSPYHDVSATLIKVRRINKAGGQSNRAPKLGEVLIDQGLVDNQQVTEALAKQQLEVPGKKIGEVLVEQGAITTDQLNQGLQELKKASGAPIDASIKIALSKLDSLIDMIGELVITGTQVAQNPIVRDCDDQRLGKDVGQFSRIIREVQEVAMSMRLVPIRPVFQKMLRVVRDLSKKSGKEVDVVLVGESTEIDKNIVDLINDPLMHMVRNSVDHGIEPDAESRAKAGKSKKGRVELNAYHKGGNIVIEIKDDGRGLNKDKILAKAKERNIAGLNEIKSDKDIFNLIFEPGFSTADQVTDISGRGVGMDVVRRNIEELRGKIEIESEEGKGSTFYIKLPLTLAIIDGIVLRSGVERYIVPIFSVLEFIQPRKDKISSVVGKGEVIDIHGHLYKIVKLHEMFDCEGAQTDVEQMVGCLVDSDRGKICLMVDELLGQQQVVIKGLTERFKKVKGLAGATILGDGRVGLILDINGIVRTFLQ